jgi:acyl transferase domain-containing protein
VSHTNRPQLSAVKLALLARKVRQEIPDSSVLQSEPIAVIGLACRFPGADSPSAYWSLLRDGVDAIAEVPRERWDAEGFYDRDLTTPGKMATKWGGFLTGVDFFDPKFFGIAPREAASMDPQQRILLETAFEALDDAGLVQERLASSATGVFVACYNDDYALWRMSDLSRIDAYTGLGTAHCVACGRLSFLLDLRGPSLVVDTGCSSSLVAVHLAVQSLRAGECRAALAAGVNLVLSPEMTVSLSKWGFMAADGRCKTFDARADGFVRGEGCGVVVLKRLADAIGDGDRVLAVIRGTAVNEDGRSTVLTAPSGPAQQAVIGQALENARVDASEITYIEAHGTGTALGDPIEVGALADALGREGEAPCLVGSVKTNVGHLEAAAGMAGLIKTVLALRHEYIPPSLHFRQLNPDITLEGTRLQVAADGRSWPRDRERRRLAGVSSFGFGGTNAHVIVEEAPMLPAPETDASTYLLPISARSASSLEALAARYAAMLRPDEGPSAWDVCYTASVRRTHHEYRAVAAGRTKAELGDAMAAIAAGESRWDAAKGRRLAGRRSGPVFVFCGQGPQWWAMGRELARRDDVFRATLEEVAALIDPVAGWSLLAELQADESASRLADTAVAQPAIFAIQVALTAALRARGVEPAAVVGHSVGEIAAACAAGLLPLDRAARLVVHRGRIMQQATGSGRMVSASVTPEVGEQLAARHPGRLAVAAVNGPRSIVLAGTPEAVEATVGELIRTRAAHRMLPVNYAFHSQQMQSLVPELTATIGRERIVAPAIPFFSTVTGGRFDGDGAVGAYWVQNVTRPVLFAAAIESCVTAGYDTFLEIGPHPVLSGAIAESAQGIDAKVVPTLHRGRPEDLSLAAAIGHVHAVGHGIEWSRIYPAGRVVDLPRYPWQRERYWIERADPAPAPASAPADVPAPLIGARLRSPLLKDAVFESRVSATAPAFVGDHRVHGVAVFPATGYLALAFDAAAETFGERPTRLRDIAFQEPLVLDAAPRRVQVIVGDRDGLRTIRVVSLASETDDRWTEHAVATIDLAASADDGGEVAPESGGQPVTAAEHYQRLAARGCDFGPSFRRLLGVVRTADGRAIADVQGGRSGDFEPGVLDACLQALNALLPGEATYLPVAIDAVAVAGPLDGALRAVASLEPSRGTDDRRTAVVTVFDSAGQVIARLDGIRLQQARRGALLGAASRVPEGWLHRVAWHPEPLRPPAAAAVGPTRWVGVGGDAGLLDLFRIRLVEAGHDVHVLPPGAGAQEVSAAVRVAGAPGAAIVAAVAGSASTSTPDDVQRATERACASMLAAVQGAVLAGTRPRLFVVTRGAQQTGHEAAAADPVAAAVLGMMRSVALEHPELACRCVDLDAVPAGEAVELLWRELSGPSSELEVALRAGRRLVPRLERAALPAPRPAFPVSLQVTRRGVLDGLRYVQARRIVPGPAEVEVEVRATGLNFRDVLNVLGRYPGHAGAPGDELAGVVTAVGTEVRDLAVGDAVVGTAHACFASFAVGRADRLVKKPDGLTFVEAATIPSAFLTAHYALDRIARVRSGEAVLVHAGAGGVGLAAIQLAQRAGARVFATAGSPEKRDYLRSLGIAHVMDSRTTDFAREVMAVTEGRGVDVVLNSLAGDFIPAGLSALAPEGRFVEIGRTGVWTTDQVKASRPDVEYSVLFLVDEFDRDPAGARTALADLVQQVADGRLRPLPVRVFERDATVDAFRHMAAARHIGKVVVEHELPQAATGRFAADGTYLVTGGLGAIGLQVARHLVERGARTIVLVSRRDAAGETGDAIRRLGATGARIVVLRADVAAPDAVPSLRRALQPLPPLRGIVHAAGVLDDGVVMEQTDERFAAVLAPKVAGTRALETVSDGMSLDFFVMFSAGASLFGSGGQSNYSAANAFLDGTAWRRRRKGRRGLSVNWGPWAAAGMAASLSERDRRRFTDRGIAPIDVEQGLHVFERLVHQARDGQVAVVPVDWARFVTGAGSGAPFVAGLVGEVASVEREDSQRRTIARDLAAAPAAERSRLLLAHVTRAVLRVLGLSSSYDLDVNQGLRDLGLDSLMAVELRNVLQESVEKPLTATLAFDHPTVAALSAHLAEVLGVAAPARAADLVPAASAASQGAAADATANVADLSDEEAEAQLAAELAALERMDIHGD